MRLIAALLLFGLTAQNSRAGWTLGSNSVKAAPAGLEFSERTASSAAESATLWTVSFNPKTHAFAVMDNPGGAFDLGSASEKRGVLAAVNGGYFHPDRTPLGLLIRQGVQIHQLEKAKLLGGVVSVTPGAISIQRANAFKPSPAIREALQAGPFLVEGGRKIAGLDATREAARTVVFQDSRGRTGFLICKSVSLAAMAEILSEPAIFPEGGMVRALNLDGGSSTALWVRAEPPFYQREWKSVRDYLAIVPR